MTSLRSLAIIWIVGVNGCVSTGTRPRDMTVAGHHAAAAAEHEKAAEHARQYDPAAGRRRCPTYLGDADCGPSWSSSVNPTEYHRRQAEKHHRLAEQHRAASQALREAEARACAGIAPSDRDVTPFEHVEDIDRVEVIEKEALGPGGLLGARVVFRAVPDLTAEWLQRATDCHLARLAAIGVEAPELASCPLAFKGVTARVKLALNGFAVEILAPDERTAALVIARARALVERRSDRAPRAGT